MPGNREDFQSSVYDLHDLALEQEPIYIPNLIEIVLEKMMLTDDELQTVNRQQ